MPEAVPHSAARPNWFRTANTSDQVTRSKISVAGLGPPDAARPKAEYVVVNSAAMTAIRCDRTSGKHRR